MASFDRAFSSSPVLTLPSQSVHRVPLDRPIVPTQFVSMSQSAIWSQFATQNPMLAPRGRKRSRDEAAVNLDPPEKAPPAPVVETEDEWEFGFGMTLIKKNSGYIADAGSQSGTWVEEKAAQEEARKKEAALDAQYQEAQERPSLRSHKSSRLDLTAALLPAQESSTSRSSPGRDASPDTCTQPVVDDFTLHLGIGWSRLSDDEHIQAAARGWAKYVENHFPVTDAKIRLESRGLQSYLVEANEGYFLFAENLRQGRLVSQTADRALQNLKSSPLVFDGPETMDAAESPKPAGVIPVAPAAPTMSNKTAPADVHMDMS